MYDDIYTPAVENATVSGDDREPSAAEIEQYILQSELGLRHLAAHEPIPAYCEEVHKNAPFFASLHYEDIAEVGYTEDDIWHFLGGEGTVAEARRNDEYDFLAELEKLGKEDELKCEPNRDELKKKKLRKVTSQIGHMEFIKSLSAEKRNSFFEQVRLIKIEAAEEMRKKSAAFERRAVLLFNRLANSDGDKVGHLKEIAEWLLKVDWRIRARRPDLERIQRVVREAEQAAAAAQNAHDARSNTVPSDSESGGIEEYRPTIVRTANDRISQGKRPDRKTPIRLRTRQYGEGKADVSAVRNVRKKQPLTAERLRDLLSYDPATGFFTWRVPYGTKKAGDRAGSYNGAHSYARIRIDGADYVAHRLAYLHMRSEWPDTEIDHADGNPQNNAWSNLRLATPSQNVANTRRSSRNTTGKKGVSFDSTRNQYRACITVDGKRRHLGYFDTKAQAHAAYREAAERHHGEFARTEFCFGLAISP